MGNIGTTAGIFYNTGMFNDGDSFGDFDYSTANFSAFDTEAGQNYGVAGTYGLGFNRRQEGIIQYMGSTGPMSYRFAMTQGERDETTTQGGDGTEQKVDPVIYSTGIAYSEGPVWMAVTYQKHEDWVAGGLGNPNGLGKATSVVGTSDSESWRIAGRYIADMGNGASLTLSAMFETLEYEMNNVDATVFDDIGFSTNAIGDVTAGDNVKIERDAWLISGKYATGGPLNFRFMYAEADDYEGSWTVVGGGADNLKNDSGAEMLVLGAYYSLGDST
jgi:hypothetical protein